MFALNASLARQEDGPPENMARGLSGCLGLANLGNRGDAPMGPKEREIRTLFNLNTQQEKD